MSEYSIADFLEALADDALEKKIIKLISEGHSDEEVLTRILDMMGRKKKNDNL